MNKLFLSCALVGFLASSPSFAAGVDEAKVGLDLAHMGLADLASVQFDEALKAKDLSPADREKTFYNLGTVHLQNNRPDLALQAFDEALKLEPRQSRTLINKAEALRAMRQYQAALKTLDDVLLGAPANAEAHYARGLNLMSLDRVEEAEAAFRSARKQKDDPRYDIGLGRALQVQKQFKKALDVLDAVIDENPKNAEAYIYRSAAYHGLGEKRKAGDDLTKAFRLAPNDPAVRSYYEQRRYARVPVSYKLTAETETLSAPQAGAPAYMKLAKGTMIDTPSCDAGGWCRVMLGRTLAGYVKKSALTKVSGRKGS